MGVLLSIIHIWTGVMFFMSLNIVQILRHVLSFILWIGIRGNNR